MKKIVYIAHPIGGDIENNLLDLRRILRIINTNTHPRMMEIGMEMKMESFIPFDFSNVHPCAPYYADIVSLDDDNPLERKRGIDNDIALINTGMFQELWLTGDKISFGMSEEVKLFKLLGKPIIDYTNKI